MWYVYFITSEEWFSQKDTHYVDMHVGICVLKRSITVKSLFFLPSFPITPLLSVPPSPLPPSPPPSPPLSSSPLPPRHQRSVHEGSSGSD